MMRCPQNIVFGHLNRPYGNSSLPVPTFCTLALDDDIKLVGLPDSSNICSTNEISSRKVCQTKKANQTSIATRKNPNKLLSGSKDCLQTLKFAVQVKDKKPQG